MEIVVVGIENSGKTTLVSQLQFGESRMTTPTMGLNVKEFKKKNLKMKVWDIGGQVQYRQEWGLYSKGADVLIFVVDTSNMETIGISKRELNTILSENEMQGIPILVIGNKIDVNPHMTEQQLIKNLNLDYLHYNLWAIIMISAKFGTNVEDAVDWLIKNTKKKQK